MEIQKNYDLTRLNTFGVSSQAKFFVEVKSELDLKELFTAPEFKNNNIMFLGGGSNVLFAKDFDGIVILNKLKGIEILEEDSDSIVIKSMSGEIWHDLVLFCVSRGYWGIENLSLIPGTVGAAPMQNIGAYGAELKDIFIGLEAIEIKTGEKRIFTKKECEFGYRDSVFKNKEKNKYFIFSIAIKLSKIPKPNISYKILKEYFENNKIMPDSVKKISEAVMSIRKSKLPDPKEIGNAGSFFKNVFVDEKRNEELKKLYPDMPSFKEEETIKIPAGWLIEKCGWKGKRIGNVGVHERQALVLVNHGGATGEEIRGLSSDIVNSVFEKFGITLTPEVNYI